MRRVKAHRYLAIIVCLPLLSACSKDSSPSGPSATCALTVPQTTFEVGFTGGANNIFVSTQNSCTWNVSTSDAFLTITSAASMTGSGSVSFTVAQNTGAARQGAIAVGSVRVTVNQAAGAPGIEFPSQNIGPAVVGAAFSYQFTATGGVGALRYSIQNGVLPIGLSMDASGRVSGTPVAPGTSTFGVCATDTTSRSTCRAVTLVVNPAGRTDSPILGVWTGSLTLNTGCLPGLPQTVSWSGTFRRAANNAIELVVSIPSAGVNGEAVPVTLSGNTLTFTITVDARYDFRATLSSDFRSLSGTFTGSNCAPPPLPAITPSGTWTGTKQ